MYNTGPHYFSTKWTFILIALLIIVLVALLFPSHLTFIIANVLGFGLFAALTILILKDDSVPENSES